MIPVVLAMMGALVLMATVFGLMAYHSDAARQARWVLDTTEAEANLRDLRVTQLAADLEELGRQAADAREYVEGLGRRRGA